MFGLGFIPDLKEVVVFLIELVKNKSIKNIRNMF